MSLGRENSLQEGESKNHQENIIFSYDVFDVHLDCLANLFLFFLLNKCDQEITWKAYYRYACVYRYTHKWNI